MGHINRNFDCRVALYITYTARKLSSYSNKGVEFGKKGATRLLRRATKEGIGGGGRSIGPTNVFEPFWLDVKPMKLVWTSI